MAREFFSNLPDTDTPLEAGRLNRLLDGDESQGHIVVDTIMGTNLVDSSQRTPLDTDSSGLTVNYDVQNKCYKVNGSLLMSSATMTVIGPYTNNNSFLYINKNYGYYTFSNNLGLPNIVSTYNSATSQADTITSIDPITIQTTSTLQLLNYYVSLNRSFSNELLKVQVQKGQEATSYEPYQRVNIEDTGFTINTHISSNWIPLNDSTRVKYRRIGDIVNVVGIIKSYAGEGIYESYVGVLPYYPIMDIYTVCQGTDMNRYLLRIDTNGSMYISRFGTTTETGISTNDVLAFNVMFIADSYSSSN